MARKKRAAKKTTKTKKKVKSKSKKTKAIRKLSVKDKIKIVFNRLLFFIALSLVSFVLYRYIQNNLLGNLFFIMAIIFGFISVSFLIVLIILAIIKTVRKR